MPRIKKSTLPPEIKESLTRRYPYIRFEGSYHEFTIGDKVMEHYHAELEGRVGVVVAFDRAQVITYFKGSNFNGTRGTDICTMGCSHYTKV